MRANDLLGYIRFLQRQEYIIELELLLNQH
jgi:hypothetical protein